MTKLVLLTGKKRSGKSTVAKHLEKKGYTRINFKDELIRLMKEECAGHLDGLASQYRTNNHENMMEWLFEHKPPLMRTFMQSVGSVKRAADPYYFVKAWEKSYCDIYPEKVVVDDCRYLNEAETARKYGATIIRVVRDAALQEKDAHSSETEMDQIKPDYTVTVKDGQIDELLDQIDELV